jgi:hypothetical protein
MNNASKGRCVTVTPRGKSEDETLKAKPGIRKRQCWGRSEKRQQREWVAGATTITTFPMGRLPFSEFCLFPS